MPAAVHTFDSVGGEFDPPISFKGSSASLKKNSMHAPSSASLKPSSSAQHCQRSKLKRLRVEEDDLMPDTDSADEIPIALRKKLGERKSKRTNTGGARADDEKPIASTNKLAMPSLHMFESDDGEFDGPISFKRSRSCVKKNRPTPTPTSSSGNAVKPNSLAQLKRLRVEDVHTSDTDSDDEKPIALRKKVCERKPKGINRKGTKPDGDYDDSDDERPIALRKNVHERKLKIINAGGAKADGDHDHDSDDERPIVFRKKVYERKTKRINTGGAKAHDENDLDSDDEKPLAARLANNNASPRNGGNVSDDDSEDDKPLAAHSSQVTRSILSSKHKKILPDSKGLSRCANATRNSVKQTGDYSNETSSNASASASVEREPEDDGRKKWSTLRHNGVVFPPPYKPHGVKMLYNGQLVHLTPEQEEVATMFAVMKDTEYASKETFINNFFTDWRKILGKTHIITKFELCDFTQIYEWHLREKEKKNQMTSEEKKALREEKSKQEEKFMWAFVDGVKEKVGNFRVEPPGLFRGRGEHPKMGRLKRRIRPSDITINIGEEAPIPVCPIPGESWKEFKHDNTVTWLACWNDPINEKDIKYVFLAASSSLKGQNDKEKYEKARKLKDYIGSIRANYTKDFRSKDQVKKQIAVATYLIDKLALRAGNEKDEDEADTVGCCTLKVQNVTCLPPNKLQFDFLVKDSIRYYNTVEVELHVYEAIKEFCAGKNKGGHVFDKLDTTKLNAHLKDLMPGLTAKVFRTYNASITLDAILNKETKDGTTDEKVDVYTRANKEVAIICNHQRAVPKSHDSQMNKLNEKIDELTAQRDQLNAELEKAKKLLSKKVKKRKTVGADGDGKRRRKLTPEMLEKKLSQVETRIVETDNRKNTKEDLKTVALGTSKINYLDPRITVAWCKTMKSLLMGIRYRSLRGYFLLPL